MWSVGDDTDLELEDFITASKTFFMYQMTFLILRMTARLQTKSNEVLQSFEKQTNYLVWATIIWVIHKVFKAIIVSLGL